MLQPVGNLPARVYWRRRLVFVGLPLLAIILLLWAALSGGGDHPSSHNTSSTTTRSSTSVATTSAQPRDSGSIGVSTTTPKPTTPKPTTPKPTTPKPTPPVVTPATSAASTPAVRKGFCAVADLTVTAATAKKSYPVKSKPELSMLVTNTSASPCKLDVADKHVEWRVYSGDARVWGSHDCAVRSGSNVMTLAARQPIRLSISWSGLTSLPKCAGTRLAVQAGTYKLYAYFDGVGSPVTTFTIT
jgi:hypothetical protein